MHIYSSIGSAGAGHLRLYQCCTSLLPFTVYRLTDPAESDVWGGPARGCGGGAGRGLVTVGQLNNSNYYDYIPYLRTTLLLLLVLYTLNDMT